MFFLGRPVGCTKATKSSDSSAGAKSLISIPGRRREAQKMPRRGTERPRCREAQERPRRGPEEAQKRARRGPEEVQRRKKRKKRR